MESIAMVYQKYFAIIPNDSLLQDLREQKLSLDGSERALYSKDYHDRVSYNLDADKERVISMFLAIFCDSVAERGQSIERYSIPSFTRFWRLEVFDLCEDVDEVVIPER